MLWTKINEKDIIFLQSWEEKNEKKSISYPYNIFTFHLFEQISHLSFVFFVPIKIYWLLFLLKSDSVLSDLEYIN